ncbi:hypothetical protein Moror_14409 [Moniliophthora roreri MCA 2997]|uniref:Uncharacterized protein n=2 Tax=Moniliophthora roreri TaxID=221103 RepID=V2XSU2_MONRO|nr:hypothetical protein Moror_14409 [Moniliophthora roreri MCA 2997]
MPRLGLDLDGRNVSKGSKNVLVLLTLPVESGRMISARMLHRNLVPGTPKFRLENTEAHRIINQKPCRSDPLRRRPGGATVYVVLPVSYGTPAPLAFDAAPSIYLTYAL